MPDTLLMSSVRAIISVPVRSEIRYRNVYIVLVYALSQHGRRDAL